jgi:regulator of protease activity HflC (stomatin/prohibitin superfamily)
VITDGGAPAANATLFAANGKAMIVAITIIAAIVVVLVFIVFVFDFVDVVSTIDSRLSSHDNKGGYEFHLWIPQMVSTFGIRP